MGILPRCFGGSGSSKQPSTTVEYLCHRFSLARLRKSTNNFHISRKIGQGYFGDVEVYRGSISINGETKEIAVKRGRRKAGRDAALWLSELKNEIVLRCQLQHPNLVPFIGFCSDKNEMMVVYDYIPNGSLNDRLNGRESKSPILSWKKRLEISIGVARGLHYLHAGTKRTIIHRNVNSTNILLDENWVPKLTYFELSLKGPKFSSKVAKTIEVDYILGRHLFMAPEYAIYGRLTDRSDVYSFGMVLLELICGKVPSEVMIMDQASEGEPVPSEVYLRGISEREREGKLGPRTSSEVTSGDLFQGGDEDENLDSNVNEGEHALPFWRNIGKQVRSLAEKGNAERIIDPRLVGEIAPECWKLYMDIAESCLSKDANERPAMGEVEVELEGALQLQEEADANQQFHAFFQP